MSGCDLVVDSSKHPSLAHCLRWQPDLDLRVLHLVRDSRAVAYSWSRQVRRPDTDTESYMTRYSPAMAAGQWNAQNAAFHLLARARRAHYAAEVRGLHRRAGRRPCAGSPISPGCRAQDDYPFLGADGRRPGLSWTTAHSVSGNPMRFTTGKIPISRDERWRTGMPKAQRQAVTALTFPLLAGYGYVGARP